MFNEETFLTLYFTEQEMTGLTHEEFQVATMSLVETGLIVVEEKNGMKYYRPTPLLLEIKEHFDSDPATRN
jgi:predicted transcriptional regulator with HTH domain